MTFDSIFSLQNPAFDELSTTPLNRAAKRVPSRSKTSETELIFGPENHLLSVLSDDHLKSLDRHQFPIVLYGPSGCGKSALAEIVSHSFCKNKKLPLQSIFKTNGTDFFRDFLDAVNLDELQQFRSSYLKHQLFVLDSVQELVKRKSIYNELIYLLDHCPHLILTSSLHPNDLELFPNQITSRLLSGLCLPISTPSVETKIRIIENEVSRFCGTISSEAAKWLAENECPTIPILKEKVSRLRIKLNFQNEIDLDGIHRVFSNRSNQSVSLNLIAKFVAKTKSLKISDLKSQSRKRVFVQARGLAIFIARNNHQYKFEEIGQFFGNRDHTTVMHSFQKVKLELTKDAEMKKCLESIVSEIVDSIQSQSG